MDKFCIIDCYSIYSQKKNKTYYCIVIYNRTYHFDYTVFVDEKKFDEYVEEYSSKIELLDVSEKIQKVYDNTKQNFVYYIK